MEAEANIPSLENLVSYASSLFKKHFNEEPDVCGCAPGRVNLLGEHIDYNDGFVLPMVGLNALYLRLKKQIHFKNYNFYKFIFY